MDMFLLLKKNGIVEEEEDTSALLLALRTLWVGLKHQLVRGRVSKETHISFIKITCT